MFLVLLVRLDLLALRDLQEQQALFLDPLDLLDPPERGANADFPVRRRPLEQLDPLDLWDRLDRKVNVDYRGLKALLEELIRLLLQRSMI